MSFRRAYLELEQNTFNFERFIPFNQSYHYLAADATDHKKIIQVWKKYSGLCEILCNKLLIHGDLENIETKKDLKKLLCLNGLVRDNFTQTHILENISWTELAKAFLHRRYPMNLLTDEEQKMICSPSEEKEKSSLNQEILQRKLRLLSDGTLVKILFVTKGMFSFSGHSVLLKKESDLTFHYFEPNLGLYKGLDISTIADKISSDFGSGNFTDLVLIDGLAYKQHLSSKQIG